jgi:type I restriction enzyme S subunit
MDDKRWTEADRELPAGWVWTTLGEIADATKKRRNPTENASLPFIGMEHIEAHTMRLLKTVPAGDIWEIASLSE